MTNFAVTSIEFCQALFDETDVREGFGNAGGHGNDDTARELPGNSRAVSGKTYTEPESAPRFLPAAKTVERLAPHAAHAMLD